MLMLMLMAAPPHRGLYSLCCSVGPHNGCSWRLQPHIFSSYNNQMEKEKKTRACFCIIEFNGDPWYNRKFTVSSINDCTQHSFQLIPSIKWHKNKGSMVALRKGERDRRKYCTEDNTEVHCRCRNIQRRKTDGERKDSRLQTLLLSDSHYHVSFYTSQHISSLWARRTQRLHILWSLKASIAPPALSPKYTQRSSHVLL